MEMSEGDSADTCAGKFPLMSMGGCAEGLACADLGARTPIGLSGILVPLPPKMVRNISNPRNIMDQFLGPKLNTLAADTIKWTLNTEQVPILQNYPKLEPNIPKIPTLPKTFSLLSTYMF